MMVVEPLLVLVPVRSVAPVPDWTTLPAPEMLPEMVWAAVFGKFSVPVVITVAIG